MEIGLFTEFSSYHEGRRAAGHDAPGEVSVIVPVYVAETDRRAREDTEASTMHFFRTVGEALMRGPRRETGQRLKSMSFDEVLEDFAIYGSPEHVADRLLELRDAIGYRSLAVWMNVGGQVPHERVLGSMRRFAECVVPRIA